MYIIIFNELNDSTHTSAVGGRSVCGGGGAIALFGGAVTHGGRAVAHGGRAIARAPGGGGRLEQERQQRDEHCNRELSCHHFNYNCQLVVKMGEACHH